MAINKITIDNKKYPELLKKINQPPEQLYYKGNWRSEIFENCLAVVGSRRMTKYGEKITTKLVSEIAGAGITIVSGFMYGIDATSQQACVNVGGKTIAVMPCGVDIVHPSYQDELYNEILNKGGLIISEFEPGFPPDRWTYPKRNRIIAGLSKATMVVEAALKSGSLITANYTKKYNRKLFAVPGPLTSSVSKGTTKLLKEGARVADAKDIIRFYNQERSNLKSQINKTETEFKTEADLQAKIFEQLKVEPMEIDDLSRLFKVPVAKIGSILSLMELKGIVEKEEGKYYLS